MKTNVKRNLVHKREYVTVGSSLILLLLLTLTIAPITTSTVQTTQSAPQQEAIRGNPMEESDIAVSTYWAKSYVSGSDDYARSVQQTADEGYIVAGTSQSPDDYSNDLWVLRLDSTGGVVWQKAYGGSGDDQAFSIQQTTDQGYIVCGRTSSFGAGGYDFWVLKLDSAGSVIWERTYGGSGEDQARSVRQTADGGHVVAGYTDSFGAGGYDFWLLKLNSTGEVTWQRTYGGSGSDVAYAVQQTADGGYVVAGTTNSSGAGDYDFWALRLGPLGFVIWQRTYGGSGTDIAYAIQQTADSGYVVVGTTDSFGAGDYDFWVLKLGPWGFVTWQRTYGRGGLYEDKAYSVQQTTDGGYIVAGYTSNTGTMRLADVWLLKLNSTGGVSWQKAYGGSYGGRREEAYSVQETADGGYIVAGTESSFGVYWYNAWVVKLAPYGEIIWDPGSGASTYGTHVPPASSTGAVSATSVTPTNSTAAIANTAVTPRSTQMTVRTQATPGLTLPYWAKTYGGGGTDIAECIQQTADGGYIVAGLTGSFGALFDVWVLKLDCKGGIMWETAYGGNDTDWAEYVEQTGDGGYIVAGYTDSFGAGGYDFWVLKLDSIGGVTWQKTYGGGNDDLAYSVHQTADGGYIVAGETQSFGPEERVNMWILKLDSEGAVVWNEAYGGGARGSSNYANSIEQTADGGYIVAGYTRDLGVSFGYDAWVLKLDSLGSITWQRAYGADGIPEEAYSVQQTADGGYVVAGWNSFNLWVFKLDTTGGIAWQKTYGGANDAVAYSVRQTTDGGYIVAGSTNSFGAGGDDFWVLKLNSTGGVMWQNAYGGPSDDDAYSVQQTVDGGYVVAGFTYLDYTYGNAWVVKLLADGSIVWDAGSSASTSVTTANLVAWVRPATTTSATVASGSVWHSYTDVTPHNTEATIVVHSPPHAPAIDQPSNVLYTVGQTGNSISWNSSSQIPSHYVITRDESIVASGVWNGTSITQNVDGLDVGTYIYTCTVNDTLSRSNSSSVQVLVVLEAAPTIDQPDNITYAVSQTGNSITWHPSSEMPDAYQIIRDGEIVASGNWDGASITQSVDGLAVGSYVYTCTVNDTLGRRADSSVGVLVVLPPIPTIDQPSNVTYYVGTTGHTITWHPSSQIPDHYTISVNSGSPTSYDWDGEAVTLNVDGWTEGTYSVNCTVYDTQGRSANSTVTVTVQPASTTTTTTTTITTASTATSSTTTGGTSPEFPMLMVGGVVVAAVVIVIAVFALRKRKT